MKAKLRYQGMIILIADCLYYKTLWQRAVNLNSDFPFYPHKTRPPYTNLILSRVHPLPMDYREINELPEWVKLVNKVIHGNLTLEDLSPTVEAAE